MNGEIMKRRIKLIVFAVLSVAAVLLTVYGIADGGFTDIMNKAIRICNECIGLG